MTAPSQLRPSPYEVIADYERRSLAHVAGLPEQLDAPGMWRGVGFRIGGKRLRQISTPHVPHGWEAQVLFEETTGTLLCGDLFSQVGAGPALVTDDVVGPALAAEGMFGATCLAPHTGSTLRSLADLEPTTLAIMHGPSFQGDGGRALRDLAIAYDELADSARAPVAG